MASHHAISAVCEGVIELLREQYRREDFNNDLEFAVFLARHFTEQPLDAGVSLFLYRVVPNTSSRNPGGAIGSNGRRRRPKLPLDLHFLLTVWGRDASLQHAVAGWLMRVMEDFPVVPSSLLNLRVPDAFRPEEAVELTLGELSNEDLFRLWETLAQNVYHLSIPYVARMVMIESEVEIASGPAVEERLLNYTRMPARESE